MTPNVLVLGAGYSGLVAAKLVARHTSATVTLVNADSRFVERVRNHQLATGQHWRHRSLDELLAGTGVRLVVDRVTRIDAAHRRVHLAGESQPLGYDVLIYALGSRADTASVPGVAEHAFTVADAEQATRLAERLRSAGTVAVVGGGLTGIETAAELAESRPELKVRLVTGGQLGAGLSERGRRHLHRTFGRLGVEVHEHATVTSVDADGVLLADGGHVGADTVVWTTGFTVPPLAREAGFAVDGRGRLVVDGSQRSVSHPEVYGIGDAAAAHQPDGQELRMACATGMPVAHHAATAIAARFAGREPGPLRFRFINQCISLGRRDALIQFVHADDTPHEVVLGGRVAALYKEAIVRGAAYTQRRPGLAAIGAGPRRS
jgi:NADH:ubiquinone reductase (H+-translocating)